METPPLSIMQLACQCLIGVRDFKAHLHCKRIIEWLKSRSDEVSGYTDSAVVASKDPPCAPMQ